MPFGNESTWDFCYHDNRNKQAIKSPMPFGNESTWDTETRRTRIEHLDVTNAFRQRVHLRPNTMKHILSILIGSPMPFGNKSTWDRTIPKRSKSA